MLRFEFYFIIPLTASIGSQRIVSILGIMKILFMLDSELPVNLQLHVANYTCISDWRFATWPR